MKHLMSIALLVSSLAFAHDEGHGPKLNDSPKQGGKVAPVVAASEAKKGPAAALIYKSELVQDEAGNVKVYFYDRQMNVLGADQVAKFDKSASASVEHIKKGKIAKTTTFPLELKEGIFVGKLAEKPKTPTFNVDVKFKEGDKELLAAFDGLEVTKN